LVFIKYLRVFFVKIFQDRVVKALVKGNQTLEWHGKERFTMMNRRINFGADQSTIEKPRVV
jgi:hypothetical protein